MAKVQRVLYKFAGQRKSRKLPGTSSGLVKRTPYYGVQYVIEDLFFTFPLPLLPFEPGHVSDEHGETFHQDISTMRERYVGKWSQHMLADYRWNLTEEVSIASYRRMSYRKKF